MECEGGACAESPRGEWGERALCPWCHEGGTGAVRMRPSNGVQEIGDQKVQSNHTVAETLKFCAWVLEKQGQKGLATESFGVSFVLQP